MNTLTITNEAKRMVTTLEINDGKVYGATIKYMEAVPLSDFINCAAIVRTPSGCGNPVTVPPSSTVVRTSTPNKNK